MDTRKTYRASVYSEQLVFVANSPEDAEAKYDAYWRCEPCPEHNGAWMGEGEGWAHCDCFTAQEDNVWHTWSIDGEPGQWDPSEGEEGPAESSYWVAEDGSYGGGKVLIGKRGLTKFQENVLAELWDSGRYAYFHALMTGQDTSEWESEV